jgi:carboxylate-amine ligase
MHALATDIESEVSDADRYRLIAASMRSLARRAPTMALHVHVGIPEPESAIRVLNRLRENVPMLLALSANSPFTAGRDSGFCSARTLVFDGFPRTGTPRAFGGYEDYVETIDGLVRLGAFPDYTFLWWDVRLQPSLGTVEVRVMDAQTTAGEAAPLVALVQSLARRELEGDSPGPPIGPEALAENRFAAARDGLEARQIDPRRGRVVALRALVHEVLEDCMPHAAALGCAAELEQVMRVAAVNGAERQRSWASAGGVTSIAPRLAAWFTRDRRR